MKNYINSQLGLIRFLLTAPGARALRQQQQPEEVEEVEEEEEQEEEGYEPCSGRRSSAPGNGEQALRTPRGRGPGHRQVAARADLPSPPPP